MQKYNSSQSSSINLLQPPNAVASQHSNSTASNPLKALEQQHIDIKNQQRQREAARDDLRIADTKKKGDSTVFWDSGKANIHRHNRHHCADEAEEIDQAALPPNSAVSEGLGFTNNASFQSGTLVDHLHPQVIEDSPRISAFMSFQQPEASVHPSGGGLGAKGEEGEREGSAPAIVGGYMSKSVNKNSPTLGLGANRFDNQTASAPNFGDSNSRNVEGRKGSSSSLTMIDKGEPPARSKSKAGGGEGALAASGRVSAGATSVNSDTGFYSTRNNTESLQGTPPLTQTLSVSIARPASQAVSQPLALGSISSNKNINKDVPTSRQQEDNPQQGYTYQYLEPSTLPEPPQRGAGTTNDSFGGDFTYNYMQPPTATSDTPRPTREGYHREISPMPLTGRPAASAANAPSSSRQGGGQPVFASSRGGSDEPSASARGRGFDATLAANDISRMQQLSGCQAAPQSTLEAYPIGFVPAASASMRSNVGVGAPTSAGGPVLSPIGARSNDEYSNNHNRAGSRGLSGASPRNLTYNDNENNDDRGGGLARADRAPAGGGGQGDSREEAAASEGRQRTSGSLSPEATMRIDVLNYGRNHAREYPTNAICTSKYTVVSFVPLNLFEQFRRLSNTYFLLVMTLTLIPGASPVNPLSAVVPLALVVGVAAVKDAYEDFRRHRSDAKANSMPAHVLRKGEFVDIPSEDVLVGDVLKIHHGEEIRADCVLLSSSLPEGTAYIETSNLDGETNAKTKRSLEVTHEALKNERDLLVYCNVHDAPELTLPDRFKTSLKTFPTRFIAGFRQAFNALAESAGCSKLSEDNSDKIDKRADKEGKERASLNCPDAHHDNSPSTHQHEQQQQQPPTRNSPVAAANHSSTTNRYPFNASGSHQAGTMGSRDLLADSPGGYIGRGDDAEEMRELLPPTNSAPHLGLASTANPRMLAAAQGQSLLLSANTASPHPLDSATMRGGGTAVDDSNGILVGGVIGHDGEHTAHTAASQLSTRHTDGCAGSGSGSLSFKAQQEMLGNGDGPGAKYGIRIIAAMPDANLAYWQGVLKMGCPDSAHSLGLDNFLFRGAILRNTEWALAAVVYSGVETKMFLNLKQKPPKRSQFDKQMNWLILAMFIATIALVVTFASLAVAYHKSHRANWYMEPYIYDKSTIEIWGWRFITHFILLSYLIPISLFITLEINKGLQVLFISMDGEMSDYNADRREWRMCRPKTSNLTSQLGRVKYIFADKTGTLTENRMTFVGGHIDTVVFKTRQDVPFEGPLDDESDENAGAGGQTTNNDDNNNNDPTSGTNINTNSNNKRPRRLGGDVFGGASRLNLNSEGEDTSGGEGGTPSNHASNTPSVARGPNDNAGGSAVNDNDSEADGAFNAVNNNITHGTTRSGGASEGGNGEVGSIAGSLNNRSHNHAPHTMAEGGAHSRMELTNAQRLLEGGDGQQGPMASGDIHNIKPTLREVVGSDALGFELIRCGFIPSRAFLKRKRKEAIEEKRLEALTGVAGGGKSTAQTPGISGAVSAAMPSITKVGGRTISMSIAGLTPAKWASQADRRAHASVLAHTRGISNNLGIIDGASTSTGPINTTGADAFIPRHGRGVSGVLSSEANTALSAGFAGVGGLSSNPDAFPVGGSESSLSHTSSGAAHQRPGVVIGPQHQRRRTDLAQIAAAGTGTPPQVQGGVSAPIFNVADLTAAGSGPFHAASASQGFFHPRVQSMGADSNVSALSYGAGMGRQRLEGSSLFMYLLSLSACHNVVCFEPRPDKLASMSEFAPQKTRKIYEGQSLDEVALVHAAADNFFELVDRTSREMTIEIMGRCYTYDIIAELEFTPQRKLMSIILKRNAEKDAMSHQRRKSYVHSISAHGRAKSNLASMNASVRHDRTGSVQTNANTMLARSRMTGKGTLNPAVGDGIQHQQQFSGQGLFQSSGTVHVPTSSYGGIDLINPINRANPALIDVLSHINHNENPNFFHSHSHSYSYGGGGGFTNRKGVHLCRNDPTTSLRIIDDADEAVYPYLMLTKGADSSMMPLINMSLQVNQDMAMKVEESLLSMASSGLRTLVLGYRRLSQQDVDKFLPVLKAANQSMGDRNTLLHEAYATIEKQFTLIGATAVEDKLQEGVPETIDFFVRAKVVVWMLTGDKRETAVTIAGTSGIIDPVQTKEVVHIDVTHVPDEDKITQVASQIKRAKELIYKEPPNTVVLVIDGVSLNAALQVDPLSMGLDADCNFFELGSKCRAAVCCRMTPLQKADVVRMFQTTTGHVALAIGDGANDVSMIQEAEIGVGIMGLEGAQAELASDFAIPKFRHLKRLMIVHGRHSVYRDALTVMYSIYKCIVIVVALSIYSGESAFSGQAAFNSWFLSMYNSFYCQVQALALGIIDKDLPDELLETNPLLYPELAEKKTYFNRREWVMTVLEAALVGAALSLTALTTLSANDLSMTRTCSLADLGSIWFIAIIVVMDTAATLRFLRSWTYVTIGTMIFGYVVLIVFTFAISNILNFGGSTLAGVALKIFNSFIFYAQILIAVAGFFVCISLLKYYLLDELLFPSTSANKAVDTVINKQRGLVAKLTKDEQERLHAEADAVAKAAAEALREAEGFDVNYEGIDEEDVAAGGRGDDPMADDHFRPEPNPYQSDDDMSGPDAPQERTITNNNDNGVAEGVLIVPQIREDTTGGTARTATTDTTTTALSSGNVNIQFVNPSPTGPADGQPERLFGNSSNPQSHQNSLMRRKTSANRLPPTSQEHSLSNRPLLATNASSTEQQPFSPDTHPSER